MKPTRIATMASKKPGWDSHCQVYAWWAAASPPAVMSPDRPGQAIFTSAALKLSLTAGIAAIPKTTMTRM